MPVPCRYRAAVVPLRRLEPGCVRRDDARERNQRADIPVSNSRRHGPPIANRAPHRHRQAKSGTCRGREPPHARHTFEVLPSETTPHRSIFPGMYRQVLIDHREPARDLLRLVAGVDRRLLDHLLEPCLADAGKSPILARHHSHVQSSLCDRSTSWSVLTMPSVSACPIWPCYVNRHHRFEWLYVNWLSP